MLRIVAISNCDPVDTYLLQKVNEHWPFVGLIHPQWEKRPGSKPKKKRFPNPFRSLCDRVRSAYYNRYFARVRQHITHELFDSEIVPKIDGRGIGSDMGIS